MTRAWLTFAALALAALAACKPIHWLQPPEPGQDVCHPHAADGGSDLSVLLALEPPDDPAHFYDSPFPALNRTDYLPTCPSPLPLLNRFRQLIPLGSDYSTTSGVFFGLSGPGDDQNLPESFSVPPVLPWPDGGPRTFPLDDGGTLVAGAAGLGALPPVFLFRLEGPDGPLDAGYQLQPVQVQRSQVPAGNPCGTGQFVLSVLPVQGRPLEPDSVYVAAITRRFAAQEDSAHLVRSLCNGVVPDKLLLAGPNLQRYLDAFTALKSPSFGLTCDEIAGLTVFKTGDPTAEFRRFVSFAREHTPLRVSDDDGGLSLQDHTCATSRFCTFVGSVDVPAYQKGIPPYSAYFDWDTSPGGNWAAGSDGEPLPNLVTAADGGRVPATIRARLVVTVPREPMPDAGFPLVVLVRAGAGGDHDPLVDRGPTFATSCEYADCQGPAEVFTGVGWAGLTLDGPLVGISRTAPLLVQEDLAIFNFLNPPALRDNVRESALELALLPRLLETLTVTPEEAARCDLLDTQGGPVRFDTSRLAIFAHSMGASIAPLALAVPEAGHDYYRAAILSGSGGSFIENIIYKRDPVPIAAGGELVGYSASCSPQATDPEMSMIQRALEPADSQVYAKDLIDAGVQILMLQGVEDHYILPPIADAMTLAEGLDLGVSSQTCSGQADCDNLPEPNGCVTGVAVNDGYPSLKALLPLSSHRVLPLPVRGNARAGDGRPVTAVVVQHRPPRIDGCPCRDGHEVAYEDELARHQQECFLRGLDDDGGTRVPATGGLFSECQ